MCVFRAILTVWDIFARSGFLAFVCFIAGWSSLGTFVVALILGAPDYAGALAIFSLAWLGLGMLAAARYHDRERRRAMRELRARAHRISSR
jgi:hypothetical protein